MKKLIAVSGKIASGKTTVSNYLVDKGYVRQPIAVELKEIGNWWIQHDSGNEMATTPELERLISKVSGADDDLFRKYADMLTKDIFPKYIGVNWGVEKCKEHRLLLQDIGHNLRTIKDTVWIDGLRNRIKDSNLVVVDDMRYPNEADELKKAGVTIIRLDVSPEVQRERALRIYGALDPSSFEHAGEVALDNYENFDMRVSADMPLQDMLDTISKFIFEEN